MLPVTYWDAVCEVRSMGRTCTFTVFTSPVRGSIGAREGSALRCGLDFLGFAKPAAEPEYNRHDYQQPCTQAQQRCSHLLAQPPIIGLSGSRQVDGIGMGSSSALRSTDGTRLVPRGAL